MAGQPAGAGRRDLRFDAGSLALDLVATRGRRGDAARPIERMAGVEDLLRWCEGAGVRLAADTDLEAILADLHVLREQVYELAAHARRGEAVEAALLAHLNGRAEHPVPSARFVVGRSGVRSVEVSRPHLDADELVSLIVRDLMALLASEQRRLRLRECEGEDCRMLFELPAGARERRWCSMSRCGNRAKVARHRARTTDRPPADPGRPLTASASGALAIAGVKTDRPVTTL